MTAPEPVFEEAWHAFTSHLPHRHTSAAPAAATTTKENHMSVLDEIEADVKNFASSALAKFQSVDRELLNAVDAIQASPETAAVVKGIGTLLGLNLPPNTISEALGGVRALLLAYAPATQAGQQQAQQGVPQQ